MPESRTRARIRRAAEAHGLTIDTLEWEPIRTGSEMAGAAGGWFVDFTEGGHVLAYNASELIENIKLHAERRDERKYWGERYA